MQKRKKILASTKSSSPSQTAGGVKLSPRDKVSGSELQSQPVQGQVFLFLFPGEGAEVPCKHERELGHFRDSRR